MLLFNVEEPGVTWVILDIPFFMCLENQTSSKSWELKDYKKNTQYYHTQCENRWYPRWIQCLYENSPSLWNVSDFLLPHSALYDFEKIVCVYKSLAGARTNFRNSSFVKITETTVHLTPEPYNPRSLLRTLTAVLRTLTACHITFAFSSFQRDPVTPSEVSRIREFKNKSPPFLTRLYRIIQRSTHQSLGFSNTLRFDESPRKIRNTQVFFYQSTLLTLKINGGYQESVNDRNKKLKK